MDEDAWRERERGREREREIHTLGVLFFLQYTLYELLWSMFAVDAVCNRSLSNVLCLLEF